MLNTSPRLIAFGYYTIGILKSCSKIIWVECALFQIKNHLWIWGFKQVKYLPVCVWPWIRSPASHKPGMVAYVCNPILGRQREKNEEFKVIFSDLENLSLVWNA